MDLQTRLVELRAKAQARGLTPASSASLGERLERLRVGTPLRAPATVEALAASVGGIVIASGLVEVARACALPFEHGEVAIADGESLANAARSVGKLAGEISPGQLLFLDTETTGLAGGTGTTAFMVGLGWIEGRTLRLVQWLMAEFAAESALVARVADRFRQASAIVSFNGKSFDLPLLKTRARLVGQELAADSLDHVDLLHVTRRLLRAGWPDCRLRTAEARALRLERADDLPGAEAPGAWRRWLAHGDASLLGRVLDHNRADLLSLVALLALLEHPTIREAPLLHAPV